MSQLSIDAQLAQLKERLDFWMKSNQPKPDEVYTQISYMQSRAVRSTEDKSASRFFAYLEIGCSAQGFALAIARHRARVFAVSAALSDAIARQEHFEIFVLSRALIEHQASAFHFLRDARKLSVNGIAQDRISEFNSLASTPLQTRVDWQLLEDAKSLADLDRKTLENIGPMLDESKLDLRAQVMGSLDVLNKFSPHARLIHAILSEFVHPSFGATIAVCSKTKPWSDRNNVIWTERSVAPVGLAWADRDYPAVVAEVFAEIGALAASSQAWFDELESIQFNLMKAVQSHLRRPELGDLASEVRDLDWCLCTSKKRWSACCGLKTSKA
jgi:hypothetical protein